MLNGQCSMVTDRVEEAGLSRPVVTRPHSPHVQCRLADFLPLEQHQDLTFLASRLYEFLVFLQCSSPSDESPSQDETPDMRRLRDEFNGAMRMLGVKSREERRRLLRGVLDTALTLDVHFCGKRDGGEGVGW